AALRADALQRSQDAIGVVRALDIARDRGAQGAVRRRMVRVAVDADRAAVVDGDEHRAGVGTVVWTGGADNGGDHLQTMAYPLLRPGATGKLAARSLPCKSSNRSSPTPLRSPPCGATSMPIRSSASRKSAP